MVIAMAHTVSAREANQRFSDILGRAEAGETVVITKRGVPVAELVPYGEGTADDGRAEAWDRLMSTLEAGFHLGDEPFVRDELYER